MDYVIAASDKMARYSRRIVIPAFIAYINYSKFTTMTNCYQLPSRLLTILLIFLSPVLLLAQAPTVSYVSEITGLSAPVDLVNAGDGTNRLFIVEQAGIVKVRNGSTITQFANFGAGGANIISSGGERGLLSMAFHPNYDGVNNRYFFIYYTNAAGDIAVTRYQTTAGNINTADLGTGTSIIVVPHPGQSNHNGGKLNFGADGYLYFATGDGGGANDVPNNAQNGTVLLGKMLRLDINQMSTTYGNYSVPPDNPYVNDPNVDDRIWALGLRNPFRWSFDRANGDMWIGDVGQGTQEEINFRAAGTTGHVNYGWRCFEGYVSTPGVADCTPADYVPPVFDYPNPGTGSAVTGGYVYRGTEFPTFVGYYVAADVYSGNVYVLWPRASGGFDSSIQTNMPVSFVVGFGEGEDGTLYAVSQGSNAVYKVVATDGGPLPVTLTNFSGTVNTGFNELKWQTAAEYKTARFNIEYSKDGAPFTRAGTVIATRNSSGSSYNFRHVINNKDDLLYRLAIEDDNGKVAYSPVIRLNGKARSGIQIYPTVINNGFINLQANGKQVKSLKLINTSGVVVYKNEPKNSGNTLAISLPPALSKGMYLVEITLSDGQAVMERILIQ